jgi:hypothetical protein
MSAGVTVKKCFGCGTLTISTDYLCYPCSKIKEGMKMFTIQNEILEALDRVAKTTPQLVWLLHNPPRHD